MLFISVLLSLLQPNASYAVREIDVVLVRTAEASGSNPSQVTAAGFQKQIDFANIAYAGSGIKFKFDPVKGFPPIVKDPLLHRDWVLAKDEDLSGPATLDPRVDDSLFTPAKNNFARKKYPGKLVVFSGAGNGFKHNGSKWVLTELEGAYSSGIDLYLRWHKTDDSRVGLFAHEVGHHLHLPHTFVDSNQPKDIVAWRGLIYPYVAKGISDFNFLFDGDSDVVSDTAVDPGAALFSTAAGPICGTKNELKLDYIRGSERVYVSYFPDRANIMSYFFCNNLTPTMSAGQKNRVARSVEYGHRIYLRTLNPGISVPRYSPSLSVASWGPGRLDILANGFDLTVLHKAWDSQSGWHPAPTEKTWWRHKGESVGRPAIISWGKGRLDLFTRGINGRVRHMAYDNGWHPAMDQWSDLGGSIAGDVAAVSWGFNRIDLFGRGYDGNVYHKAWDGQNWWPSLTGWTSLGGAGVSSDPAVVSWTAGRLDIVVRGKEGDVLHKAWDGQNWYPSLTEWSSLGGKIPLGSTPAIASRGVGRLDIAVRGMDNGIWYKSYSAQSGWFPSLDGFQPLGGSVTSSPDMASWGPNQLIIAARGADGHLKARFWEGADWAPKDDWMNLAGDMLEDSVPKIVSWAPGRIDVFIRNSNYEIAHKYLQSPLGWGPAGKEWEKLGKYIE